jgi:hypothetical protein
MSHQKEKRNTGALVKLVTAPNTIVAELWQHVLKNEGIPTMVRPMIAAFPYMTDGPCDLLVLPEQLDHAREILAALLDADN